MRNLRICLFVVWAFSHHVHAQDISNPKYFSRYSRTIPHEVLFPPERFLDASRHVMAFFQAEKQTPGFQLEVSESIGLLDGLRTFHLQTLDGHMSCYTVEEIQLIVEAFIDVCRQMRKVDFVLEWQDWLENYKITYITHYDAESCRCGKCDKTAHIHE
jgi:hypothetical protein